MPHQTLSFEVDDAVAIISMNRPEEANTITQLFAEEFSEVAIACASSTEIRSVILTARGKFFSAGGDLAGLAKSGDSLPADLRKLTAPFHSAISRLSRMDQPLITAINGPAAGAGLSLAMLGDYAIASEAAKFTMAYSAVGLSPDGASSYLLPRLIGVRKTAELMITNRTLSAAEALEWNMVNEVCPADELMGRAQALASQLALGPTKSYGAIKALLLDSLSATLETQMEAEARYIAAMADTEDGKEGIGAFLEKRQPVFSGK